MKIRETSIVIVTYNNEKTIRSCLESILKYSSGVEIIVVDNASQDKTSEVVREFREVILIESSVNLGFAKANNLGAKKAEGQFLVFLNPDTILLASGSLEKLKETLVKNPEYGLIGPQLIYSDGTIQKSVRNLPTVLGAFKEYILNIKGAYDFYLPKSRRLCRIESVTGACMVIKKEVFQKIGGFDEKYFLYFEDLELCRSVRNKGFKVGYLPEVEIKHLVGASGEGQEVAKFLHTSAQEYHGLVIYFFIQFLIKIGHYFHR